VGRVKPFLVYSALRLGLFVVTYAVMAGIWFIAFGEGGILLVPFLAAVIVSALLSLKLLSRQREQFAAVVQARAERASRRFEEQRSKEDVD
jgi:uncharacterized membrane protein (DUF4010 family)